jgi:uncharacterized protein with von Willebrand factor type A (vWA) domain
LSIGFDPCALEARFEPLDRLGRRLWLPAIVNSEGRPVPRMAGLAEMLGRLLAGQAAFDDRDEWPAEDARTAFAGQCARLGLAALARGHEEVAEQVLRTLLWHLDRVALFAGRMPRARAIERCAAEFAADWEERSEELREVLRVVQSLDGVANFARWSEIRGLLRSESWQQVLAAHERIARMPKLAALLRRLGRRRPTEEEAPADTAVAAALEPTVQWVRRQRQVELPGVPLETEGIRRSGDFNRMLASEAMQLRRRRRLLAARLAEQTLLTYQHRQFWTELTWVQEPGAPRVRQPRPRPVLALGPVILCVDTSASMSGAPEQIAKAVVLEAMRAAAAGGRDCLLYAFSGPGDLCELELSRSVDGLLAGADFLARSFHGGTDVCEPLERSLAALRAGRWRQADMLIASDGEFGAPPELIARLDDAKRDTGLRVQGVLIGDRETIGLRKVCDDIFWVRDWRRYGAYGQVDAPVHSRKLTALYFPGAFASGGAAEGLD